MTPYFALYPTDFLADVGHLGNTELGIYWRLLLVYYRDGRPLPCDTDRLRRIAMTFSPEEARCLDQVVSEFFQLSVETDGTRVWRHKRADIEIAAAKGKHQAAVKKAQVAAEARWSKAKEYAASNASSMPKGMPGACQPEPEPVEILSDVANATSSSPGATHRPKADRLPACPSGEIVALYHEVLPELPRCRLMPEKRVRAIRKAWAWVLTSVKPDGSRRACDADQALTWFRAYFTRARDNDFLMGRTSRSAGHEGWRCDFDFLLTDRGIKQVVELTAEAP